LPLAVNSKFKEKKFFLIIFFDYTIFSKILIDLYLKGITLKKLILGFITIIFLACNGVKKASSKPETLKDTKKATIARIKTVHGDIVFNFYPKEAPNTTRRLKELISKGFYNGLKFHRVIPGFVIQGGDPKGNGTGGSGKNLVAEFNHHKHVPGTLAMARSSDPNSADSQFYISLGTHPHLDNKYTVFGFVKSGIEVAKKITSGDKMISVTLE
jgi:peptidylprolyl isomerase